MRLLGLVTAAISAVPFIRLKSWFFQKFLIAVFQLEAVAFRPVPLSGVAFSGCPSFAFKIVQLLFDLFISTKRITA